jgi:hypothetical protein
VSNESRRRAYEQNQALRQLDNRIQECDERGDGNELLREVWKRFPKEAEDARLRSAPPSESGGRGGVDSNVTNKTEIIMGDKYENVQGSTVVSRSEVKGSVYRTRDDHSTKGATGGVWRWLRTVAWSGVKKRFGW